MSGAEILQPGGRRSSEGGFKYQYDDGGGWCDDAHEPPIDPYEYCARVAKERHPNVLRARVYYPDGDLQFLRWFRNASAEELGEARARVWR